MSTFADSGLLSRPIAHRGLHRLPDAPENSLAAFRAALDRGLPIELDVRLTADGQPVVLHDADLSRVAGRDIPVSRLAANEMRQLRLLGTSEWVPLLREVLDLVAGRVPLLIELKNHGLEVGPLERAVVAALQGYPDGTFALQSFNPLSVLWLRLRAPRLCWHGQLSMGRMGIPLRMLTRPDFVALHLPLLSGPVAAEVRRRGLPLLAWTVRNANERQQALERADNYIFDASDELLALLPSESPPSTV